MDSKILYKLLKIVLLTLAISFVVDKIVFYSMNKISDKVMTGQAIGKLNHFLQVKDSVDLIVFGNSRANHHIDVDKLNSNAYNNGTDGVGIAYNSTLINTLDKSHKQFVLVHIDTKNFFDNDYDGADIRSLKTKYHRKEDITKSLDNSGQLSVLQKFYYSMNYNGNVLGILKNYLKPSYNYKTYNGYDPLKVSKSQETMRDQVLAKNSEVQCKDTLAINPIALKYLENIKALASNTNKTFWFITSPMHNDLCKEDNKRLKSLMQKFNFNYKDYSDLYKSKNDNSFWMDQTHLSQKGAEAFTNYLIQEINASL